MSKKPTPFFVVDRPASLRIIKGSNFTSHDIKIGLMSHANTSTRFQELFNLFPCTDKEFCDVIGKKCPYNKNIELCKKGKKIKENTIKMCDSGVFTKEGCTKMNYEDLFDTYENMGTDYGIIMDVLKDKDETLKTAKIAIEKYIVENRDFNLVGVAQGMTVNNYFDCYNELKKYGYSHIAIGGLLKKRENTARFVSVRDDSFMYNVLRKIRKSYPEDWLFVLGSYHPKRHQKFDYLKVYGGDYKGWIFQYKPKNQLGKDKAQKERFEQIRAYLNDEIYSRLDGTKNVEKLLIMSCSNNKVEYGENLPAFERYDGSLYRVFRKQFFNGYKDDLDMRIISAKFGLISPKKEIPNYDKRMDEKTAKKMKKEIKKKLKKISSESDYADILVVLGKDYLKAIEGIDEIFKNTGIKYADGRIGEKNRTLKLWMNNKLNKK